LRETGLRYDLILVNDGSADGTFAVMRELFVRIPEITTAVDLMKNAGQAAAITAGLAEAKGEYVLMIDSDLQLYPEELSLLMEGARAGADVVNGYRVNRQDSFRRKLPSTIANWVMRRIAGVELHDFGCTFRLVNRRLIEAFNLGPERILSIPLLISRAGRVTEVAVRHRARAHGKSGWTLAKLWRYHADNMVVLAEPVFQFTGLASLGCAVLLVVRVLLDPFLHWTLLRDVTNGLILNAVAATALITTGLLCVVGEFVVRCHRSVLARPAYVVRERLDRRLGPNSDY
jgi:glycosyltransferase involved in cell wall biosynthesis